MCANGVPFKAIVKMCRLSKSVQTQSIRLLSSLRWVHESMNYDVRLVKRIFILFSVPFWASIADASDSIYFFFFLRREKSDREWTEWQRPLARDDKSDQHHDRFSFVLFFTFSLLLSRLLWKVVKITDRKRTHFCFVFFCLSLLKWNKKNATVWRWWWDEMMITTTASKTKL